MSSPTENLPEVATKRPRPVPSPEQSAGPQPQPAPNKNDTPRVPRHPMNGNQPQMRDKIAAHNRNEIVQVKWSAFKRQYLPNFPSDDDLDEYMKLVASRPVTESSPQVLQATSESSGYSWVKFTPEKQKAVKQREGRFYKELVSACDAIAETLKEEPHERRRTFKYATDPGRANISSIAGGTNKIDGYFHSTDVDKKFIRYVTSVAVCAEFKLKSTQGMKVENRKQIVTDAHFILNDDPRRMFIFGITIEGEECCLWYFSRSHLAKSTPFQWMGADIRQFFGVLVAFTFAEPAHLGYDPTITLIYTPTQSFVYKIKDDEDDEPRFFRTTKSISEFWHTCITGRATRVWKAVEVHNPEGKEFDEPPKPVVLKDVWLDESAQTERSIQRQIFAGIEEFKGRLDNDPVELRGLKDPTFDFKKRIVSLLREGDYRKHFLSIIAEAVTPPPHSISPLLASDEARPLPDLLHNPDSVLNPPSNPHADKTRSKHSFKGKFSAQGSQVQWSQQEESKKTKASQRTFSAKQRYLVVFEEVGEALDRKESFKDVAKAMEGAVLALFLLFAAGWVHRDISTGNILWYQPPEGDGMPRGILSDLEYARRYPHSVGGADPKTGTPIFMPGEVVDGKYLYFTMNPLDREPPRAQRRSKPSLAGDEEKTPAIPAEKTLVKHNFLHDMESGFWVFLFALCNTRLPQPQVESPSHTGTNVGDVIREKPIDSPQPVQTVEEQFYEEVTGKLFAHNYLSSSVERNSVIVSRDMLKNALTKYLDPALESAIDATSTMANKLFNLYRNNLAPTGRDEQEVVTYRFNICSIFPFAYDMVTFVPETDIPLLWNTPNYISLPAVELQNDSASGGVTVASGSHNSQKRKAADNVDVDQNGTPLIPKRSRTKKGAFTKPPIL